MTDRELSCFFVTELLPLYLENHLDTIRKDQITQHLKTCAECQANFTKTKKARQILEELSHTQAQVGLIDYLKKEHNFWADFFERAGWRRWPDTLKWATQLSAVALALVVTIHLFPWLNFAKRIHTMRAAQVAAINNSQNTPVVASDDVSAQGDEEPRPFKSTVKPRPTPAAPVAEEPHTQTVAKAQPDADTETPESTETTEAAAAASAAATTAAEEGDETVKGETTDGKKTGYVWRGTLKVEELTDDLAEKVTRVVTELGGVKAGEVELGWHRGGQRYYHFILPEENYEKLLSALNGEGILTLNREVHPRVIKEGHMRIIMTLEEDQ